MMGMTHRVGDAGHGEEASSRTDRRLGSMSRGDYGFAPFCRAGLRVLSVDAFEPADRSFDEGPPGPVVGCVATAPDGGSAGD